MVPLLILRIIESIKQDRELDMIIQLLTFAQKETILLISETEPTLTAYLSLESDCDRLVEPIAADTVESRKKRD